MECEQLRTFPHSTPCSPFFSARDLPTGDNPGLRTRPKRTSLHLDASKFQLDHTVDISPQEPPTPSTGVSLASSVSQGRPRAMTQGSPSLPGPSTVPVRNRSATVANPPKSAPPGSAVPEKEKRKRSRVTPEQLTHLERIFALDKSPTAAKRKEISEMLGMQERQTQIWFQNRFVSFLPIPQTPQQTHPFPDAQRQKP